MNRLLIPALLLLLALTGCASTPASPPASSFPATPQSAATSTVTVAQQQALEAAKNYLSMGEGFSESGLLFQLTSPAGNAFQAADAQWAIDHSGADWNAQAVIAAKTYVSLGGFSRQSLIDQLDSPAGNGFTQAQAEYAATQVGL